MRLRTTRSDAAGQRTRGLGPFSSGHLTVIVVAVVAVLGVPAIASAVIPNGNTFNACAAKSNGALRVIDTSKHQKCAKTETKVSWSQTGPRGAAGTNGAPGAKGATGDPSAPLASGQSESGEFSAFGGIAASSFLVITVTYPRPLATAISGPNTLDVTSWPVTHCAGPGFADPGFLCFYEGNESGVSNFGANPGFLGDGGKSGTVGQWDTTSNDAFVGGTYTVTAP